MAKKDIDWFGSNNTNPMQNPIQNPGSNSNPLNNKGPAVSPVAPVVQPPATD